MIFNFDNLLKTNHGFCGTYLPIHQRHAEATEAFRGFSLVIFNI
jgi:hypothetical protein